MNLTQIKDEVARRYGYITWNIFENALMSCDLRSVTLAPSIMEAYAIAYQEQLRRDCADLCKLPSDKQAILETPLIK